MIDKIRVRNIDTGEVGSIRRKLFDNPRINDGVLVEVGDDAKSYAPELYKSKIEPVEDVEEAEEEESD